MWVLLDVPEQVGRLDEVVAGVHVAVVLHRQGLAAGALEDAQAGLADPAAERGIKGVDEDLAYIPAHPLVEDGDQEAAVLLCLDRTLGDQVAELRVQWSVATWPLAPALVGDGQRFSCCAFNDRDELHILRLELVAEEVVDLQGMIAIGGMDSA